MFPRIISRHQNLEIEALSIMRIRFTSYLAEWGGLRSRQVVVAEAFSLSLLSKASTYARVIKGWLLGQTCWTSCCWKIIDIYSGDTADWLIKDGLNSRWSWCWSLSKDLFHLVAHKLLKSLLDSHKSRQEAEQRHQPAGKLVKWCKLAGHVEER